MQRRVPSFLSRLIHDRRGNFAMMAGLLIIPVMAAAGLSVDYSRYVSARAHLQSLADAAALALASDEPKSKRESLDAAEAIIGADHKAATVRDVTIALLESNDETVKIQLAGKLDLTFMRIVGQETVEVAAEADAERAMKGNIEVSLILDNTWSMSSADARGVTKIAALKTAASGLVNELMTARNGPLVKIALVPYADYVNVGTQYRGKTWLDIEKEYTVPATSQTCQMSTTKYECSAWKPANSTCSSNADGIVTTWDCSGSCTQWSPTTVEPYEVCSGGSAAQDYKWWGCVGSRKNGNLRLDDSSPNSPYPGYVSTWQQCLNPIVPLTSDKAKLVSAINGMIINIGSYKPNTYIPAGLVWGLNTLSDTEPLTEAAPYDPDGNKPRKVAILMTDGANTLRYRPSDGRHVAFDSDPTKAESQLQKTDSETVTICSTMKAKGIEIFSVAFMVETDRAKSVLESCATDKDHYFDASDSAKLMESFGNIGRSMRVVRLTN